MERKDMFRALRTIEDNAQTAAKLGMNTRSVSGFTNGTRPIPNSTWAHILHVYSVTEDEAVAKTEGAPKPKSVSADELAERSAPTGDTVFSQAEDMLKAELSRLSASPYGNSPVQLYEGSARAVAYSEAAMEVTIMQQDAKAVWEANKQRSRDTRKCDEKRWWRVGEFFNRGVRDVPAGKLLLPVVRSVLLAHVDALCGLGKVATRDEVCRLVVGYFMSRDAEAADVCDKLASIVAAKFDDMVTDGQLYGNETYGYDVPEEMFACYLDIGIGDPRCAEVLCDGEAFFRYVPFTHRYRMPVELDGVPEFYWVEGKPA